MSTPRSASTTLADPVTKHPVSWADIDNDDDFGFNMPVQRLKGHDDPATPPPAVSKVAISPMDENASRVLFGSGTSPLGSPTVEAGNRTVVIKKKKKSSDGQPSTAAKKVPSPLTSIERNEAAQSFVRAEMLARNLFPSFVEVTVDGTVPYSLKSTSAVNVEGVVEGSLSPISIAACPEETQSTGNSPVQPDTSRRAFEAAEPTTTAHLSMLHQIAKSQLPAAIAATVNVNVADRSHLGRRRRAIRVVADCLVSNSGKALSVNEVARLTKWNKTFRPGLGCLFSFIKSLPSFFVYRHGLITLTYEEDIASTMLRSWAETDPQAAELQNMAVANAAALAANVNSQE